MSGNLLEIQHKMNENRSKISQKVFKILSKNKVFLSKIDEKLQFYVKRAFTKLTIITLYLLQLGYDRRLNLIFNHNR